MTIPNEKVIRVLTTANGKCNYFPTDTRERAQLVADIFQFDLKELEESGFVELPGVHISYHGA